ncbi:retrovirus-related pol polyprotein from transposon TNT 1-94 [Tanacetum coccineum]|uniref:Retrovirus-related pol polyprotein from transposon TNT 1-94 n=1 Tax=Tanacetum coccineum TaxID=301880 RepID=A0ABQ5A4T0_9ASTR
MRAKSPRAIEESKDLTSLSLDELIGNLKVYKMIIKKDSKIVKAKVKRKSIALKAKKKSSDEECSTFPGSEDEEIRMAGKNQRAFVGGSWSNRGEEDDEKVNNKTCLVAQVSSEAAPKANMGPPPGTTPGSEKRQICDNKCRVTFSEHDSEITKDGKVIGRGIRKKRLYVMKLGNKPKDKICLATIDENSTLWHRRLGHANMRLIQSLASKELVRNLPKLKFNQHFCDACKIGKKADDIK